MTTDQVLDLAAGICLVVGALLSLAAAIGLLRFPDALSRLHAATKPQILGLIFIVIAIALSARSWETALVLLPIVLFQLLLTPIAGHMVGRAGYRTKNFRRDLLLVDELQDAVTASDRAADEAMPPEEPPTKRE
jgi:multicomponent Na+:H+ antiporter subunit G